MKSDNQQRVTAQPQLPALPCRKHLSDRPIAQLEPPPPYLNKRAENPIISTLRIQSVLAQPYWQADVERGAPTVAVVEQIGPGLDVQLQGKPGCVALDKPVISASYSRINCSGVFWS